MTNPLPYADYVRIEVCANGETRVIEFASDDPERPRIAVKPADQETEAIIFGDMPARAIPPGSVRMAFEVSGPQATISTEGTR